MRKTCEASEDRARARPRSPWRRSSRRRTAPPGAPRPQAGIGSSTTSPSGVARGCRATSRGDGGSAWLRRTCGDWRFSARAGAVSEPRLGASSRPRRVALAGATRSAVTDSGGLPARSRLLQPQAGDTVELVSTQNRGVFAMSVSLAASFLVLFSALGRSAQHAVLRGPPLAAVDLLVVATRGRAFRIRTELPFRDAVKGARDRAAYLQVRVAERGAQRGGHARDRRWSPVRAPCLRRESSSVRALSLTR